MSFFAWRRALLNAAETGTPVVPPTNTGGTYFGVDYRPSIPLALRVVSVANTTQLNTAISNAIPGDRIELATGTYTGDTFLDGMVGTSANPITITTASGATVNVHEFRAFDNVHHVWVGEFYGSGTPGSFKMDQGTGATGGGLFAIGEDDNATTNGSVTDIKVCGIHFDRIGYNHMIVEGSSKRIDILNNLFTRSETPPITPDYGESIYIGEAKSDKVASENEDILVQGNEFSGSTADVVDVKPSNIRGIRILDNWIHDCNFDGTLNGFTNAAIGITQYQARQARNPEVQVLRNIVNNVRGTGSEMRARGIAVYGPAEVAFNIVVDIGEEAFNVTDSGSSFGAWYTAATKYNVHNNTSFDAGQTGGEPPVRFDLTATGQSRLRWVENLFGATVTLPPGVGEASGNFEAADADFVGPTAASTAATILTAYQLAAASAIPESVGALGQAA